MSRLTIEHTTFSLHKQHARACLKKAFRELRVLVCGRFYPNEGVVAGYGNRMRVKYTAKWGLQIAEMIFKTRSRACLKKAFRELQKTCRIHSFVSYRSILSHSSRSFPCLSWHKKAPPVGLEPTTLRLTAACSTD